MSNNLFQQNGYVLAEGFIDERTILVLSKYFENRLRRGEWAFDPEFDPTTSLAYYADPLVEVFLETGLPDVEELCELELLPTYSYARIYQKGEELKPHMDRPSCEISVTVNIASKGKPSPIYVEYGELQPKKYILKPGDAIIYKGCEVLHWRRPFQEDQINVQFMLHYVDKNGPNAEYVYDKRENLGFSKKP